MSGILSKLESMLVGSGAPRSGEEEEVEDTAADASPTTLLHECPECRTVYLCEQSRSCSTCNSMTTRVEPTD